MFKMIIDNQRSGKQELYVFGPNGKWCIPEEVLWDENVDGPLNPQLESNVGGLVRVGNQLQVDQAKLDAYNAAKIAAQQSEQNRRDTLSQVKQAFRDANVDGALTNAEVVALVKALVKYVRSIERA